MRWKAAESLFYSLSVCQSLGLSVDGLLRRLNDGERITSDDVERALGSHIA